MKMKNEDIKILQQKAHYFFDRKIPIHITLKTSIWKNGNIIEPISADFFLLDEFKDGQMPIFFLEVSDIEEFTKDGGEDEKSKMS